MALMGCEPMKSVTGASCVQRLQPCMGCASGAACGHQCGHFACHPPGLSGREDQVHQPTHGKVVQQVTARHGADVQG